VTREREPERGRDREGEPEERFEDQLARLEEIVERLEDESVGLEEALQMFEQGMALARGCRQRLEAIEQRVSQLLERDEDGPETVPLEVDTP
jgi:exodeoxyribonuclease VII small subunit